MTDISPPTPIRRRGNEPRRWCGRLASRTRRRRPFRAHRSLPGSRSDPPWSGSVLQRVAQKEIGIGTTDAQEPTAFEGPTETYSPDESERPILLADELGGDGQEELVDAIAGDQLTKKVRTPFGEDGPMALSLEGRENLIDADAFSICHGADLAGIRERLSQPRGRRRRCQDQRPNLEGPLGRIQVTARSNDHQPRCLLALERRAQRRKSVGGGRKNVLGRPERFAAFCAAGASAY